MSSSTYGRQHPDTVVDRLPADLAADVARKMKDIGTARTVVRIGDADDRREALLEAQEAETDEVVEGVPLSLSPIAGSQARGAVLGAVGFGLAGAMVGALIGLIPMLALPLGARVALWALVGAMGGAAAGFVFGGGREPELEGELRDAGGDVTVAVEDDDPEVRETARRLLAEAKLETARRARIAAEHDHPRNI